MSESPNSKPLSLGHDELVGLELADIEYRYSPRDVSIYALGVGLGMDRVNSRELEFVLEEDIKVLPTFLYAAGYPGSWFKKQELGITWTHALNWAQNFVVDTLPGPDGHVRGVTKIVGAYNRDKGKGAVIVTRREIFDVPTGARLGAIENLVIARANVIDGAPIYTSEHSKMPEREPDLVCDLQTSAQIGLLYRLSGDRNVIHSHPDMAKRAGFDTPILHGAATWGVVGHALLRTLCDYQPKRLRDIRVHFSAPVYPGDTLRTRIWHGAPGEACFQCFAVERDVLVLDRGRVAYDN